MLQRGDVMKKNRSLPWRKHYFKHYIKQTSGKKPFQVNTQNGFLPDDISLTNTLRQSSEKILYK